MRHVPRDRASYGGCGRRTIAARAFTLVELLVVIAIIVLLISLLMPALNKAKLAAMEVTCGSNLRQLHMAAQVYAANFEGALPKVADTTPGTGDWYLQLARYSGATLGGALTGSMDNKSNRNTIYLCPTNPRFYNESSNRRYTNYAMNYFFGYATATPLWVRIHQIKRPADRIYLADWRPGNNAYQQVELGWDGAVAKVIDPDNPPNTMPALYAVDIHRGGGNFVMADGHVEWIKAHRWTDHEKYTHVYRRVPVPGPPPKSVIEQR